MLAWPMMYCNALGFIPAFAIRVQNVCQRECGVMLGNCSLCCLLGDYYLNKSGMVDMPEDWKRGIDLTAFGRNAAQHERGSFTPYGYIVESGDNWERHYEGRDVPEEYRIMSYPQPPARPDPEKADFDAITTRQAATLTAKPPQPRPVVPIVLTSEKPAEKLKEDHRPSGTGHYGAVRQRTLQGISARHVQIP